MIVGNICIIALRSLIYFDSFQKNGLMEGVAVFVCRWTRFCRSARVCVCVPPSRAVSYEWTWRPGGTQLILVWPRVSGLRPVGCGAMPVHVY